VSTIPSGLLRDRTALVTGAAMGIGRAVATRLAAEGARVAAIDREPVLNSDLDLVLRHDLADLAGLAEVVARVVADIGEIDVLINAAGAFEAVTALDLSYDAYRRVMAVNLDAPVFLAGAVAPAMIRHGYGRIVNVSSIEGAFASVGGLAYDTSKGGLDQATRALAVELGPHGVLVNAVAPGFVDTRLAPEIHTDAFHETYVRRGHLPLRRAASPEEIAGPIAWLASDQNTYLTGQVIRVDGGLSATLFPADTADSDDGWPSRGTPRR
jgi:NAD(P)-dependent dehydrogenase (short-subunit alcohol dehydrogenase family)